MRIYQSGKGSTDSRSEKVLPASRRGRRLSVCIVQKVNPVGGAGMALIECVKHPLPRNDRCELYC